MPANTGASWLRCCLLLLPPCSDLLPSSLLSLGGELSNGCSSISSSSSRACGLSLSLSLCLSLSFFPPPPLHTLSLSYSPIPLTLSPPPKTLLLNTLPASFSPFLFHALPLSIFLSLSLPLLNFLLSLSRCTRVQWAAEIHSVELISQLHSYNHQPHQWATVWRKGITANRKQTSWSVGYK